MLGRVGGVREIPAGLPGAGEITEARRLAGGYDHQVWLLTRSDGSQAVVKTSEQMRPGLFAAEAQALDAIRATGAVATPRVFHAAHGHLVLEALRPAPADDNVFWERAGQAVAALHAVHGPGYGWPHDNWLGLLPQHNSWCQDGHEFFIRHRVLRFLPEPRLRAVLDAGARGAIEKICARLRDLVPPMPPALCHGDLWAGNVLATHQGQPAVIDPAVCYMWPEVDLSMMYCAPQSPGRFFAAYHEIHPPHPGWQQRMRLLHLRELLSLLAIYGDRPSMSRQVLPAIHDLIRGYG